jgi:hypothetical protein
MKFKVLILMLVFFLTPSVFAQKRKPVRKSGAAVARASRPALAPVMTICVNDPLPKGYWIVRETFSDKCPIVNNFPRALVISLDGTEPGRAPEVASAPADSLTSSIEDSRSKKPDTSKLDAENAKARAQLKGKKAAENREEAIKNAISSGNVIIGMTFGEVKAAWGEPVDVKTSFMDGCAVERWWYRKRGTRNDEVYIRFDCDGRLDYIGY